MADKVGKKEYATRFGMGVLAALFLVTSVGFSLLVIWQVKQQHKNEAVQKAATDAIAKQSTTQTTPPTTTNPTGAIKMEGTQLANFTPVASIPELQKIDTVIGTGTEVKAGDTVTAHYTGAVAATGIIFQSSHDGQNKPIPFGLNQVIKGWTDGVPGMKVGGTRRLLIPAAQAYGATPPSGSGIPANADLVFDIELTAVSSK
ncbi:MAG: putative peptidyl-prolyl cis-trans isomerase [Candidatus Saccharibacteria bacterium]|nr:putative peptidyl-prolyl cis-trans isomerase [Candidatus Saccharibacteria bacterium]